jgi:hypothetical protein
MSKQFSITRDEMYAWMTEAHESITNVMTEDTGVMIGIIRDSMAEDAMWWETSGTITDTDIIAVLEEWRADNRVEETTPTTPAPVVGTTGTGFETMSVDNLREYVATVEGEWQRGEIEGAMGRAVVRQARQRLAEAEAGDDTTPPTVRRRPDAAAIEQRYLASMFCWNMALEAGTKALRCSEAGDDEGAKRWAMTVHHYLKNYARLQYGSK